MLVDLRKQSELRELGAMVRSALLVALLFSLAVTLAACGSSSSGSSSSGSGTSATFESGPCPARLGLVLGPLGAECGTLVVPENRTIHNGRTIRLPVAIIRSKTQPPLPDPIVHMTGGPGGDALSEAPLLVQFGFNQNRDLYIMDQRGNKDTIPELTCPEIDVFNNEVIGLPYDADTTKTAHLAATKACHDRLVAAGIDLSAYNTTENSADFEDLRKVMKIKKWNVYGFSYGTDLALSFLRDHPQGVRSVTIDSVAPPSVVSLGWTWTNANEGINNIFRACAAQADCLSTYGDLAGTFAGLVQKYEASPLTTTVNDPSGNPVTVVIDGGHLVNWLAAVQQPGIAPSEIPAAIQALANGDPSTIARSRAFFADPLGNGIFGHGLAYGVFCSEWVPFEPQSQILAQGLLAFPTYSESVLSQATQLAFMTEDCGIWNVPAADASVRRATISSIPTLVIDGSFDGRTSPQWGAYAAGNLKNSTNIVIPGVGHWATYWSQCARDVITSFLANPLSPNTSCVAMQMLPTFDTSVTTLPFDALDTDLTDFAI